MATIIPVTWLPKNGYLSKKAQKNNVGTAIEEYWKVSSLQYRYPVILSTLYVDKKSPCVGPRKGALKTFKA